jgi:hypothetical protein
VRVSKLAKLRLQVLGVVKTSDACDSKKEIISFRKGLQIDKESMDGSCVRSCVIVPRCGHGFQDPVHKTPRPHPRIYPSGL